jgi:hypothetical protein
MTQKTERNNGFESWRKYVEMSGDNERTKRYIPIENNKAVKRQFKKNPDPKIDSRSIPNFLYITLGMDSVPNWLPILTRLNINMKIPNSSMFKYVFNNKMFITARAFTVIFPPSISKPFLTRLPDILQNYGE